MNTNFKRYNLIIAFTTTVILLTILSINLIFDPLWYLNGNLIGNKNYTFNERLSKVNQFIKKQNKYDCLIVGSSRTTLLNETLIDNYTCFNIAFSAGRIEEFNAYADWLIEKGVKPKLIIIGIDDFNFIIDPTELVVPEFIKNKSMPPSMILSYLSFDALKLSKRLLFDDPRKARYYDGNFIVSIVDNPPIYLPRIEKNEDIKPKPHAVNEYKLLRNKFKQTKFIAYVPPISAWRVASKNKNELNNYLESLYEISRFISPLYDFSIPSKVTRNPKNTYDGDHYGLETNNLIANRINKHTGEFGVRVDLMSKQDYFQLYQQAIESFLLSIHQTD